MKKELQRLLGGARRAIERYSMISPGDDVAVGVSGGKDSLATLCTLAALRDILDAPFEVTAVMIDPGFDRSASIRASAFDLSEINELCRRLKVSFSVVRTQIAQIVFDERKEKSPCSLCANMRRGALIDEVLRLGATKLALGHHLEDAAETAMMNLLRGGNFGCFSPVTALDDRGLTVIRPMIECTESEIRSFAKKAALPIIESPCPMDKSSERARVKELLRAFDREDPGVCARIVGALCKREIYGWHR